MKDKHTKSKELQAKLIQLISEHYLSDDFDVTKLAKLLKICDRTLHRQCTQHLSTSPGKLIQRFKIERAKELLMNITDIKSAAIGAGFKSVWTFNIAFKKELGINPSQFKKDIQTSNEFREIRKKLLKIVIKNYRIKAFDVPTFAEMVGVAERTLYRYCKNYLSSTPIQIINRIKIRKAKKLLLRDFDVSRVASETGFNTVSALAIAFKNETGVSPRNYRKENQTDKQRDIVDKVYAFLGQDIRIMSDEQIKTALREALNIFLPQRPTLLEALSDSASEHEILDLIKEFRNEK